MVGWLVGWLLQTAHFVDFGGCFFKFMSSELIKQTHRTSEPFKRNRDWRGRKFILLRGGIRQIRVDYWGNH